jgi:hypothetical protein
MTFSLFPSVLIGSIFSTRGLKVHRPELKIKIRTRRICLTEFTKRRELLALEKSNSSCRPTPRKLTVLSRAHRETAVPAANSGFS